MKPSTCRIVAVAVLSLALSGSMASAAPLIHTYTSESELLAALGVSDAEKLTLLVAWNDFGSGGPDDPPIEVLLGQNNQPPFTMASGSAHGFLLAYRPSFDPGPQVTMTLTAGGSYAVGPLSSDPVGTFGFHYFAFTSTEPFTAVSIDVPTGATLEGDFVAFFDPPTQVPEPATGALLAIGFALVASAGRRRHALR